VAGLIPDGDVGRSSGRRRRDTGRGQLFLVVAVALAALLIVLTVVLNAALYAGNLTARDDGVDDESALAYREGVVQGGSALVTYANRYNNSNYTELRSTTEARVESWSDLAGRHAAAEVSGANASFDSASNGALVDQTDESRKFTNATGTSSWEVVNATSNVRSFLLNVNRTALVDPSPSEKSSASALNSADVFAVTLENASETWQVFIYANDTNVSVKVDDPATGLSDACRVPGGNVTVDISDATVGGRDCSQLDILDDPPDPFDVQFERGENAAGTYSFVTDEEFAEVNDGDLGTAAGPPRVGHALYSVTVEVRYVTPTLRYETTVRIVPGERND
jgi:hypothetical protein